MLKKVFAAAALGSIIFLSSCKEYNTTENGLRYKILADSTTGNLAEIDGQALIHFEIKNHNDSVIESTFLRNSPVPMQIKDVKGGLEEGIQLLSKGDSAFFLINVDSLFKADQPLPPGVVRNKDLKFTVKVVDLKSKADVSKLKEAQEKEYAAMRVQMEALLATDTTKIVAHLKSKKIAYKKSSGGVYYTITSPGKGKKIAMGDTVNVDYDGKFLDGKGFDAGKGFPVVVGVSQVIYGWHMGLLELSYGDKATLYIPSPLGYGPQGGGAIPPNTILVFDVVLQDKK